MNKYLEKALWTILFDKCIDKDEFFKYTNPISMSQMELCYNELTSYNCKYSDSFIGIMIAYPDNIEKIKEV